MDRLWIKVMVFFVLVSFMALSGCGWDKKYGKLKPCPQTPKCMTIETLVDNWQDYYVHYAGPSIGSASGLIFDPKHDNRRLVLKRWYPVKDKEELTEIVRWLKADIAFGPTLYEMVVRDGHVFGYIFTPWSHVFSKLIDENTLWVEELPLPPGDYGGGAVVGGF